MLSFPQSLLARAAYRNPKLQRQRGKAGARKTYLCILRPYLIIFDNGSQQLGKITDSRGKQMWFLSSRRRMQGTTGHLSFIPGKVVSGLTWLPDIEDKKVMRNSQHRFTKRKSCLTSQITFYSQMTILVKQRKTIDIVCLGFSKAFNTLP